MAMWAANGLVFVMLFVIAYATVAGWIGHARRRRQYRARQAARFATLARQAARARAAAMESDRARDQAGPGAAQRVAVTARGRVEAALAQASETGRARRGSVRHVVMVDPHGAVAAVSAMTVRAGANVVAFEARARARARAWGRDRVRSRERPES